MPIYILHHEGKYNLYSTMSDSFLHDTALNLEQLEAEYKSQFGSKGMDEFRERIQRAHADGCSSYYEDLKQMLSCNRAGESESNLTLQECIDKFLSWENVSHVF